MSETAEHTNCEALKDTVDFYIHQRLEGQIEYYESKSSRNKKTYYVLSIAAIVANALIPVVSVFLPSAMIPKLIITLLSAVAALVSSVLILFNSRDLWAKYRLSATNLQAFKYQYLTRSGIFAGMDDQQAFRRLVEVSEQQIQDESSSWETMIQND